MAPVNDEAKKHNQNLPGMGGIYNTVNFHLYHYAGNNPIKYTDPDGNVTKEQNEERNKYQNGYAPPNKAGMDRLVAVGLFKNQGYTKTHNLTSAQNTKDDRSKWSKLDTGKINVDYRGAPETIFEGMQFIYNNKTGEIVLDEINKGTFDYRSPYGHVPYFSHKSFDIDPWIEWGAGKIDNKNDVLMPEELWTQVDLILQEFEAGKIDKKAAQKRIQAVLQKPLTPPADMKGGVEK